MKREWLKVLVSFILLALISYTAISKAKDSHDEALEQLKEKQMIQQQLLTRQCRTMWPQQGKHYELCIERVRNGLVFRRDI